MGRFRKPAMPTRTKEKDWSVAPYVFRAARSRRGDKGRDDQRVLTALHHFTVHNSTDRPGSFPKALDSARACIEQVIGKLVRSERVGLHWDETTENFAELALLACGLVLGESDHTT